jgi:hypothetical protein
MSFVNDKLYPSINERKQALYASREFMANVDCVVESSKRTMGTIASFTAFLPYAVRGVWAASLKSLSMPMNFGTLLSPLRFDVTYGAVGPGPGNIVIPAGYWYYSINQGTVTYAQAQMNLSSNNILYFILNQFAGTLDSLTVLPNSGGVNWTWDASTSGVTSTNVPAWFNLLNTTGLAWISNGSPWDLSGCRNVGIVVTDVAAQNSKSNVVAIPNYLATVPVNVSFGSVLAYEPEREDICYLGGEKNLSCVCCQVVDTATNLVLPLVTDWSMVIRFYVTQEQTS